MTKNIKGLQRRIIHESYKSIVEIFDKDGKRYARKSYNVPYILGVPLDFFAKYLCSREVKALDKINGVEWVQQIVERDSDYSFVSVYCEGTPLKRLKDVPKGVIGRLEKIVDSMHSKGVADFDLGNRSDIIINAEGNPTLIDMDSAITYSGGILNKMLFRMACRLNRRKLIRMKMNYCPETLTEKELQEAGKGNYMEIMWGNFKEALRFVKYDVCGLKRPEETGYAYRGSS